MGVGSVLLGLTTVRGMGEEVAAGIVREREANGAYRSLGDLLRRTGLPYQLTEQLIMVGALGEFGLSRRDLLWQLGLLLPQTATPSSTGVRVATRRRRPSQGRQLALQLPTDQDMVTLTDLNDWERMVVDYRVLGLSPHSHPLQELRPSLPRDIRTAARLRTTTNGAQVRTAGMVVCRQRPGTAKGFVFLLVEDETGLTNVVIRPDLYEARRSVVRGEPYVVVEGTLEVRSGTINLLATSIAPLAQASAARSPRPVLRNGQPGNPHDPREQPVPALLVAATPPSHDFH